MKKLTKVDNLCYLRIQMREDWRQTDSKETFVYRKIIKILVIHYVFKKKLAVSLILNNILFDE